MGRVALEANGRLIDDGRFRGRQGRLLFAYLAAAQSRPVPRDELAEAIWGEAPPATWEKGLTVIVSKLRSVLADDGIVLTNAFGCYRLELPGGSWVDVAAASSAAQDAEEALAAGDREQAKAAAARAVSLLAQPFLPGEEAAWVERERRELADVQGRALNVLADACLLSGDAAEAAEWAEQTISLTPYRETGYRRLMEAHVAAGNPAEALRVYERCRRLLAEELGTYPSREIESIYRTLLEVPTAPARPRPTAELTRAPHQAAARRDPRRRDDRRGRLRSRSRSRNTGLRTRRQSSERRRVSVRSPPSKVRPDTTSRIPASAPRPATSSSGRVPSGSSTQTTGRSRASTLQPDVS